MMMRNLVLMLLLAFISLPVFSAESSRLEQIQKNKTLKVCIWPDYYGITYRNPKTQQLAGIDIDLAEELGRDLKVKIEFVNSSFASFIPDVLKDRCDIAMFAIAITSARQEKLQFTKPHLKSDIYAITTRNNRRIKQWSDIDQPGVEVAVAKGTFHEPVMRQQLKNARLVVLDTPFAREQEVQSGRADVFMTDYPYVQRMLVNADWARLVAPPTAYHLVPYGYAMKQGDAVWHARVEQFVQKIKQDGRLLAAARKHKLEAIVVLD